MNFDAIRLQALVGKRASLLFYTVFTQSKCLFNQRVRSIEVGWKVDFVEIRGFGSLSTDPSI